MYVSKCILWHSGQNLLTSSSVQVGVEHNNLEKFHFKVNFSIFFQDLIINHITEPLMPFMYMHTLCTFLWIYIYIYIYMCIYIYAHLIYLHTYFFCTRTFFYNCIAIPCFSVFLYILTFSISTTEQLCNRLTVTIPPHPHSLAVFRWCR